MNKPKLHLQNSIPVHPANSYDEAVQKMEELNNANEEDPHFAPNLPSTSQHHSKFVSSCTSCSKDSEVKRATGQKTRIAPGYGYPLVKRKVKIKLSEEEIANELTILDVRFSDCEVKGEKLQQMLHFATDNGNEWTPEEDELLQEWFELVKEKNIILREESKLVFQLKLQRLEHEHADTEFQLRKLLNKPQMSKTDDDKTEEENLLKKLIEIVEQRNSIVNSIDVETQKEVKEDSAYEELQKLQDNVRKGKKRNTLLRLFARHRRKK